MVQRCSRCVVAGLRGYLPVRVYFAQFSWRISFHSTIEDKTCPRNLQKSYYRFNVLACSNPSVFSFHFTRFFTFSIERFNFPWFMNISLNFIDTFARFIGYRPVIVLGGQTRSRSDIRRFFWVGFSLTDSFERSSSSKI